MRRILSVIAPVLALTIAAPAVAAEREARLVTPGGGWSFKGPFGAFDQASLQRGYKVYREVCSACHSMNLMSFRNLGEKYGPFWDEKYPNPADNPYVKALANQVETIKTIDEESGDVKDRNGIAADRFPDPFPNEYAAKASTGGYVPPDLSLIVKAREGGADYVYSVLTGFRDAPAELTMAKNIYYNMSYPGDMSAAWKGDKHALPQGGLMGMKPPLAPDKVTFDDGTKSTIEQQAKDVTTFLAWASEPKQTERKRLGMWVLAYLIGMALLAYASYRRVWK
ncbi:MAG: cytochrome c1, partial [Alphaproteobacteria bacterium]